MPMELASSAIVQPNVRRPDGRLGGGELQLGDDPDAELLEQLGLVVRPGPRSRAEDGQDSDDVAGRRHEGQPEIGLDLAGGDRLEVGDPLVLRRAGDDERCAGAHDDGRQRTGHQRRAVDRPRAAARARRRRCPGR